MWHRPRRRWCATCPWHSLSHLGATAPTARASCESGHLPGGKKPTRRAATQAHATQTTKGPRSAHSNLKTTRARGAGRGEGRRGRKKSQGAGQQWLPAASPSTAAVAALHRCVGVFPPSLARRPRVRRALELAGIANPSGASVASASWCRGSRCRSGTSKPSPTQHRAPRASLALAGRKHARTQRSGSLRNNYHAVIQQTFVNKKRCVILATTQCRRNTP